MRCKSFIWHDTKGIQSGCKAASTSVSAYPGPWRQGGGAATQSPAERYHSGSNPDLGFFQKRYRLALFLWHIHYNVQSHCAPFSFTKSTSPVPPGGHFLLANFSQKFDQKLTSDPGGHSSPDYEKVYRQPHPDGISYSQTFHKSLIKN